MLLSGTKRESRGRSADPSSRTAFGVPPDCARPCKRLPYNTIHVQLRPLAVVKKIKRQQTVVEVEVEAKA